MTGASAMAEPEWSQRCAPRSCTLPSEERPLRIAEWDALFAEQTAAPAWPEPLRVRLELPAGAVYEERTRDLAEREDACCSFFRFTVIGTPDAVVLDIEVDQAHAAVLQAMAARADEAVTLRGRSERR